MNRQEICRLAEIWRDLWHENGVQVRITDRVKNEIKKAQKNFNPADLELLIRGHAKSEFHKSGKHTSLNYAFRESNVSRFLELATETPKAERVTFNEVQEIFCSDFFEKKRSAVWSDFGGSSAFDGNQPAAVADVGGVQIFKWDLFPALSMSFAKFGAFKFAHDRISEEKKFQIFGDKSKTAVKESKEQFLKMFQKTIGDLYV